MSIQAENVETPLIRIEGLEKSFGDNRVLQSVSFSIGRGQVVGLLGPNGSGKTTLTSILSGDLAPDAGSVEVNRSRVVFKSAADAIAQGIRILPPSVGIYPTLNIIENLFLGQELRRAFPLYGFMAWKDMEERSRELLDRVGAGDLNPKDIAGDLSSGQQQAVCLARLLAQPAKLLILDEPSSFLGVRQKIRLHEILRSESESGNAILLVSHDLEEVLSICSRILVLRKGSLTADLDRAQADNQWLALQMSAA